MTTEVLHTDRDGDILNITKAWSVTDSALVTTRARAVLVKKEEAPALALALLELSGWEADSLGGPVEHALKNLAKHIQNVADAEEAARKEAEEEARKAEEAASLDAEALALLNAYRVSLGNAPRTSLDDLRSPKVRDGWRSIAREARNVHATPEPEAAPEPPARFSIVQSEKRPGQWLLLDAEKPNRGAAFAGKANAEHGLEAAQNGTKFFFDPLALHF